MHSLEQLFQQFNSLKVLIIGDVMIDSYIYGKVSRISPEAPVPVVHVTKKEKRLGGAANVALNIKALGAQPILCNVIGDDAPGKLFMDLLQNHNMRAEGIIQSSERQTIIKERIISGSQQMLRVDYEQNIPIGKGEQEQLLQRIRQLIRQVDVIIFEDYDKGGITPTLIQKTIQWANEYNKPTVIDPKKEHFLTYTNCHLFKPNFKELVEGLKLDLKQNDEEGLKNALLQLKSKLDAKKILITRSELGMMLLDEMGTYHSIPAHIRNISDVSGAGDTVISVSALGCALNLPDKLVIELANLAGGLVCEHVGVVPIDKQKLLEEAKKLEL